MCDKVFEPKDNSRWWAVEILQTDLGTLAVLVCANQTTTLNLQILIIFSNMLKKSSMSIFMNHNSVLRQ